MRRNKVDERLAKKTTKSYPKKSTWKPNQSLIRYEIFSKVVLMTLEKEYRKLLKSWSDFWDMACDMNPQYCFICGLYIIPKMRKDTSRVKKPYKNGDVVHAYCFTKESTVERISGKLNPDAELICHADKGWSMTGKVCRLRVKNNVEAIRNHLGEFHSKEFTHEGNLEFLRAIYFLKPNGRPFRSPIA